MWLYDHQSHGVGFRGGLVNKWHLAGPELLATFRAFCPGVMATTGGCSHLV